MVDVNDGGQVREILVKPQQTDLTHSWCIAVWAPKVTRFMHEHLAAIKELSEEQPELFLGEVMQAAMRKGLRLEGVKVSDEPFLDV